MQRKGVLYFHKGKKNIFLKKNEKNSNRRATGTEDRVRNQIREQTEVYSRRTN